MQRYDLANYSREQLVAWCRSHSWYGDQSDKRHWDYVKLDGSSGSVCQMPDGRYLVDGVSPFRTREEVEATFSGFPLGD